jgi:alkylation response protein AidB-like acyl-CoA dehydrogenase
VLSARPDGDGWILDGSAPWVTSWGTAEVLAVAAPVLDGSDSADSPDGPNRLLWCLVPASEGRGLRVEQRFDLMVFQASATVSVTFDRFRVGPGQVISVADLAAWSASDRLLAARPSPLCLAVGDRALSLLVEHRPEVAARLRPWWDDVSARSEAACVAVDEGSDRADPAAVAAMRAESVLAVQRMTTALLSVVSGRGVERSEPAQRLAREALFYVVQAQNDDGRDALLGRLETG